MLSTTKGRGEAMDEDQEIQRIGRRKRELERRLEIVSSMRPKSTLFDDGIEMDDRATEVSRITSQLRLLDYEEDKLERQKSRKKREAERAKKAAEREKEAAKRRKEAEIKLRKEIVNELNKIIAEIGAEKKRAVEQQQRFNSAKAFNKAFGEAKKKYGKAEAWRNMEKWLTDDLKERLAKIKK